MTTAPFNPLLNSTSQIEPPLLLCKSQAYLSSGVSEFGLTQARGQALPFHS